MKPRNYILILLLFGFNFLFGQDLRVLVLSEYAVENGINIKLDKVDFQCTKSIMFLDKPYQPTNQLEFAHFDLERALDTADLVYRLNALLPADIAVRNIYRVAPDAHARFDALERTYEYHVVQYKDPFARDRAHYVHLPLNLEAMNLAAAELLKYTDFQCFSKSNTDVKTYVCHLREARWNPVGETLVFTITADRFLRNMVRAIVGTLLDVGLGKSDVENVNSIIKRRDRGEAGVSVPAKGLYLTRILYPDTLLQPHG